MKVKLLQVCASESHSEDFYEKVFGGIGEHSPWTEIEESKLSDLYQALYEANRQLKKENSEWQYILLRYIPNQQEQIKILLDDWILAQEKEKKRREQEQIRYKKKQEQSKKDREKKKLEKLMAKYNLKKV